MTSFDVFDTVIARAVSRPTAVFLFLARNAPEKMTPAEFAKLRVQAEREAEENSQGRQPRLAEIYDTLYELSGWDRSTLPLLQNDEVKLEKRLSYGVPETLERIKEVRKSGQPVVFISDMYLPSETIIDLLKQSGAWEEGDQVYVSGDYRASKREGSLFRKVLEAEGLTPAELHHTGDNPMGDLAKPRELGISSSLIAPTKLNQYEKVLDRHSGSTAGLASLLSGTACVARLHSVETDEHATGLETVALSVAAPILVSFAKWLVDEATRQDIDRLYFVARDGYVIKKFVDAIIAIESSPVKTIYLYGSRQAWRPVTLTGDTNTDLSWAFESTETVSIEAIFERMGTTPSLAEDLLEEWGFASATWGAPLSHEELNELKQRFEKCSEIQSRIAQALHDQRETALNYLDQEGLFEDSNWAMVDLGWHGSLQTSLSALLSQRGGKCIMGLYFGLKSRSEGGPKDDACRAFLFDQNSNEHTSLIPSWIYLMESFCTAPHGTCTGYIEDNGKYQPIFRAGHGESLTSWGLETVHKAYQRYLSFLDIELLAREDASVMKPALVELLEEFSLHPGLNEAQAWGQFPYENDQNAAGITPLAQAKHASIKNLLYCLNVGELPHSFIEWDGGAWSQTSPTSRRALSAARSLGRIKVRLGQFFHK